MAGIGQKVRINYTCTLDDGKVIAREIDKENPFEFIVGSGAVIPVLSRVVSEMSVGETRQVRIPAEEAYGIYDESLIEAVPLESIPDAADLPVGSYITLGIPSGRVRVKVLKIENDTVFFDLNHELAGQALNMDITYLYAYGESGTNLENEEYAGGGCGCGCDIVHEQLAPHNHHEHYGGEVDKHVSTQ